MAQKKHKKRKHNNRSNAQSVEQAASAASEESTESKKTGFLASKKADKDVKAKKAAKLAKGKDGKAAKPSLWQRFTSYCKAVRSEMQRVVWPTRQELVNASLIVVGAIIFFGVYIAIIDNIIIIPLDWVSALGA